jgi:hypothetical protein
VLALAAGLAGLLLLGPSATTRPALAAVVHRQGFEATVLGWTSWYGSYDMGPLGAAWCIDHGLHAPDPALGYVAVDPSDLSATTKAAMAWAVTKYGTGADAIGAAALMLTLHDLRGAVYPLGRLDVDRLAPSQLAGFGSHEAEVVARARSMKADAVAHDRLVAPLHLTLSAGAPVGASGPVTVRLTDAAGAALAGVAVSLVAHGASIDPPSGLVTSGDGSVRATYRLDRPGLGGDVVLVASARAIDPRLHAAGPTAAAAQRVAVPSWTTVSATTTLHVAPPTTTSTSTTSTSASTTSTSTTSTSTTSTSTSTSTTTTPASTSTSTTGTSTTLATSTTSTSPSTTGPSTTVPSTPSTTAPVASVAPVAGTLPRTGSRAGAWALVGLGLVLLGAALVSIGRARDPA